MMNRSVCIVSTYPPQRCGIATYTAALTQAMAAQGASVTVLSEQGAVDGSFCDVTSLPTWDRHEDWVNNILAGVRKLNPNIVHLQHAPDILGWDHRLPGLLENLEREGVITVITFHTVHTMGSGLMEGRFNVPFYHRRLAKYADAIVVHGTVTQAEELLRHGITAEKIFVIPHGTKIFNPPEQSESRARLALSKRGPVLLYFGFIHALKNLHTIIHAMKYLTERVPDIYLLVAGSVQNRGWYNRLYLWYCRRMIRKLGLHKQVELRETFVPDELVPFLYGASDLVLLPYSQHYGSASGVLHNALGAGKLMLCSESPKFSEIAEYISPELRVATFDPKAWAERIEHILLHKAAQDDLSARMKSYAEETSWRRIAAQHLELYEKLISAKSSQHQ